MKDRVFTLGGRRYMWFETRPVYSVTFKPNAHELWAHYFDDCECNLPRHIKFFEDRLGKSFDVYSWDNTPTVSTMFYDVGDGDLSLPSTLFESFDPEWRANP